MNGSLYSLLEGLLKQCLPASTRPDKQKSFRRHGPESSETVGIAQVLLDFSELDLDVVEARDIAEHRLLASLWRYAAGAGASFFSSITA